ncbi:hypothetical protein QYE76_027174 [Lolium multiflorum]|uniref:Reverse transcriptase Ty1/copia-type domain-containing protein n=1 Tax=Lolium multiflorum TaxID=4521 RepID=A0AAD8UXS6_LOLMU|nr:hypothetical protein QYE76_027174 [Lolium multiflorum]
MSMMGELKFFLGFQVRQLAKGTFISQEKYVKDMLKKFNLTNASPMKTPMPVKGQLGSCDGEKDVDIKDPAPGPVNRPLKRPVRRVARSTGWQTGPSGLSSGWTGPYAGSPSSSHNFIKTLEYMLCSLASLFSDDMYTYPTAILALFADSQVVRVVMTVVLLPREEGMRGLRGAALALAYPAKQLRAVFQLFRETLISKSGDSSECRAYHLNLMYYCRPENQKTIYGCDLLYCELRRSVRERITPNYAQYIQLLINKFVPTPHNKKDQRVKMETFKMPTQGDRPEIPAMLPFERRSKERHDPASSSYSRRPKRGGSRFLTSLWQMCKNTNDVAHQILALNQENRRRQNDFMAARNTHVPPPGPEMEHVYAPTREMPPIDDEMLQNFDLSMYTHGGLPPRSAQDPETSGYREDDDDDEETNKIQLSGKSSEFMQKALFFQNNDGARRTIKVEARGPHTIGSAAQGARTALWCGPPPASDALLRTYLSSHLKTHAEKSKSPNPPTPPHRVNPLLERVSVSPALLDGNSEEIIAAITANASTSTSHVSPSMCE